MKKIPFACAFAFVSAGCTTMLSTQHVGLKKDPSVGVLYALPMAAFDIEAHVVVTTCTVAPSGIAALDYELTTGSILHSFVPDPGEIYSIDYAMLNSALKATNITVTLHPNGMIKEVNADVEDKTAQVLSSAGKTVLNLYKAAAAGFVPMAAPAATKSCGAFIDDKIKERRELLGGNIAKAKALDDALDQDKEAADAIAVQLEAAASKLAEAQKAKDQAAVSALTPKIADLKAKQAVALKKLEKRSPQLPTLKAKLDALTQALTVKLRMSSWTPIGTGDVICMPMASNQKEFFDKLAQLENAKPLYSVRSDDEFLIEACVKPLPESRRANPASDSPATYAGLVYRMPASGSVWIQNSNRKSEKVFADTPVSLPQFGAKGLVWLENKSFDKNNIKASFNADGTLYELNFTAQSRAEHAAAAASDVSGTIVDLMKLRADVTKERAQAVDAEQKKAQQKQLDAIDSQITLLQKRKDLEAARLPTKDGYDIQKDQLQKEIELEKLRQELAELKAKAPSP